MIPATLLADRTAVVTGGANGMGAVAAHTLAAAGVRRGFVVDLPRVIAQSEPPHGWSAVGVDLRDADATEAAFAGIRDRLGHVDVLVAAAGVVPLWTTVAEVDLEEWDDVFRVNTRGVLCSIRGVLPALSDDAAIVVIASQNAWRGSQHLASYTASKHAVLGLVRSAALELGPRGVRVNAVAPGSVATGAYLSRLERRASEGGLAVVDSLQRDAAGTVLQRLASAEEVAHCILFLASPLARGVSGHMLPVGAGVR